MQLICKWGNRVILARLSLPLMTSTLSKRSSMPVPDIVGTLVSSLCSRGFRRTHALVCLLREMTEDPHPHTLAEWAALPSLQERDMATLYRLMMRLEQAGVVRRVHLNGRCPSFQLRQEHEDAEAYLVCTSCGGLEAVDAPAGVRNQEVELSRQSGWRQVRHELRFFGLCPQCVGVKNEPACPR